MLLGALANPQLPCEGQGALQAIFADGPARAANGSQISFRLQCCYVVFVHRFTVFNGDLKILQCIGRKIVHKIFVIFLAMSLCFVSG